MKTKINIVIIKVLDRLKEAGRLQKTLSDNSKIIKTRFGFHELNDYKCSRMGLVILELNGSDEECNNLIQELSNIGGIITKVMSFNN
ncbi:MAG: hypothetical protein WHW07_08230 [Bacteroidales bacterium]|jgi:hypothetical protein|nr:hypothetical protein [Flavobacterium piscis]HOK38414.1 hypothetical protein [Bacteroidales bacterium]HOL97695.1 hypothetical protein [Bacteroidales bacterium]HOM37422.1 hypothetical protein [Bacteroidales bacterium]HPD24927.1 hypothetical protein [Bacteroidales bacterium]